MTSSVRLTGIFEKRDAAVDALSKTGDVAIVSRAGHRRWLLIRCPDGCGETVSVNLDERAGPAWDLDERKGLSLYPSVWRDNGCRSHFILWRGDIWWHVPSGLRGTAKLKRLLLELLERTADEMSEAQLAKHLSVDPWEIRASGEALAREGRVRARVAAGRYHFLRER